MARFTAIPKHVLLSPATKSPLEPCLRLKRYQTVWVAEEVKILGELVTKLRSTTLSILFSYKPARGCLF